MKTADLMIVIKSVAKKAPAMGDGDEGFVPPKDLKGISIKEPGEGPVNPIPQQMLKEYGEKAKKEKKALDLSNPWLQAAGGGLAGAGVGYGLGSLLDRWGRSRKLKRLMATGLTEPEAEAEVARSVAMKPQASEAQNLAILLGLGGGALPLTMHYAPIWGQKIRETIEEIDRRARKRRFKIGSDVEQEEASRKKAQAFDWGVRFALAERGIPPGPRQELAVKVAMALAAGKIKHPHDTMACVKQAADDWVSEEDEGFNLGNWITKETKGLHPLAKLLLLTGGGGALGAGAGAVGDKLLEAAGRRPSHALTILGLLTGGGLGAYKHVKDIAGPVPGYDSRLGLR